MSTHADAIREAERAVVEAAVAETKLEHELAHILKFPRAVEHDDLPQHIDRELLGAGRARQEAVDALLALRAATCPECKGEARVMIAVDPEDYDPCPANCERGRRREP